MAIKKKKEEEEEIYGSYHLIKLKCSGNSLRMQ